VISIIREREIIQCAGETVSNNGFKSLPVDLKQIAKASKIDLMPWKPDKLGGVRFFDEGRGGFWNWLLHCD
jgi:hypothetical protein